MYILSKDPMSYKQYLKKGEDISVKVRIIKSRVFHKNSIQDISVHFSMHRNSVRNIMLLYDSQACDEFKKKILCDISFSSEELKRL